MSVQEYAFSEEEKYTPFPTQPVFANFAEKLPVALHTPEGAHTEHACSIDCKQGSCDLSALVLWLSLHFCLVELDMGFCDGKCTYGIELACKDLEHYQCEAELAEAGADVCAFERALGGANLDKFLRR